MSALFEPLQLRSVTLPNRIVLSPMCQYSATDGVPNNWHRIHLGRYATAGLGLIIAEATHVNAKARITPGCLGLYNAVQEAAFAEIAADVKQFGPTPFGIQLAHAGRKASADLPWRGGHSLQGPLAWPTVAPSPIPHDTGWHIPAELDEEGLDEIKREFVSAAQRADRAGTDLIEMHGAHGYLFHEFVSPISNKRKDNYGGSLENRMRFPLEVFEAVRAAWPAHKPLGMRITGSDWMGSEGLEVADAIAFAARLKELGADFVDVSSGGVSDAAEDQDRPGIPGAFRRSREEGHRAGHHGSGHDHRGATSRGHRQKRQGRPGGDGARPAERSLLGLAGRRPARRRGASRAPVSAWPGARRRYAPRSHPQGGALTSHRMQPGES